MQELRNEYTCQFITWTLYTVSDGELAKYDRFYVFVGLIAPLESKNKANLYFWY